MKYPSGKSHYAKYIELYTGFIWVNWVKNDAVYFSSYICISDEDEMTWENHWLGVYC